MLDIIKNMTDRKELLQSSDALRMFVTKDDFDGKIDLVFLRQIEDVSDPCHATHQHLFTDIYF